MGQDDDQDCAGHVWRLRNVAFEDDGAHTTYRCQECGALLPVEPHGIHPVTA